MKISLLLLISFLLLTACASTPEPATESAVSASARAGSIESHYDTEWMQRYEGAARRGGVKVYWVNLPRRQQE